MLPEVGFSLLTAQPVAFTALNGEAVLLNGEAVLEEVRVVARDARVVAADQSGAHLALLRQRYAHVVCDQPRLVLKTSSAQASLDYPEEDPVIPYAAERVELADPFGRRARLSYAAVSTFWKATSSEVQALEASQQNIATDVPAAAFGVIALDLRARYNLGLTTLLATGRAQVRRIDIETCCHDESVALPVGRMRWQYTVDCSGLADNDCQWHTDNQCTISRTRVFRTQFRAGLLPNATIPVEDVVVPAPVEEVELVGHDGTF